MNSHRVVKWFRDYADDIEAVNIHYALTVLGETPDWNHVRTTRYMPLVGTSIRMKELRLPPFVSDCQGRPSHQYTLHYYFEVCRGGDRQYSPLYSEEVVSGPTKPGEEVGQLEEDGERS